MLKKFQAMSYKKQSLIVIVMALVLFLILSGLIHFKLINRYYSGIILTIFINIILVASLNITCGFLGQLTLGHAGFMAIGAYTSSFLTKTFLTSSLGFWPAMLIGGLVALVFGLIVCLPTLRLKGDYLAIVTLAAGEVIKTVLLNLNIVGGASGYIGIPQYTSFTNAFFVMLVILLIISSLNHSHFGRVFKAIRDDEIAASASGLNINRYKLLAFALSAFFAGIAGALYAHYIGIIEPTIFGFDRSIEILVMLVIGGMGSLSGSIIGASIITLLPEFLKGISSYRTLIYAIALIVIMLFKYDQRLITLKVKIKQLFKGGRSHESIGS